METRYMFIDGVMTVAITMPVNTPETAWIFAFQAYLVPAGSVTLMLEDEV